MPLSREQQQYAEQALAVVPVVLRTFRRRHPEWRRCLSRMDCEGIAGLAVTKAAGTYDPARSQVTTYFSTAICNALTKAVQREYREARNTAIHATERDRVRTLAARDTRQLDQMQGAVDEALSSLPAKARLLIELRFKRRMSLRQIAEQSGRDARTIQGWMDDAMAALETLLRSDFGPP